MQVASSQAHPEVQRLSFRSRNIVRFAYNHDLSFFFSDKDWYHNLFDEIIPG
jgi:hypothetical protein